MACARLWVDFPIQQSRPTIARASAIDEIVLTKMHTFHRQIARDLRDDR